MLLLIHYSKSFKPRFCSFVRSISTPATPLACSTWQIFTGICVFVYLCIWVFVYLCIWVFEYLCICVFECLCICVFVYLCIRVLHSISILVPSLFNGREKQFWKVVIGKQRDNLKEIGLERRAAWEWQTDCIGFWEEEKGLLAAGASPEFSTKSTF